MQWRSPGRAPTADPCGVAGAYSTPAGGAGAKPAGAQKRGYPGSKLPPLAGVKTVWKRGQTAEVGWMVGANHGGGYLFSLCPKGQPITEACFDKMPLHYATSNTTIRYLTGRLPDQQIPARDVSTAHAFTRAHVSAAQPLPHAALTLATETQHGVTIYGAAVQVAVGTHPTGSRWRVNPIPACNCDNGGQTPLTKVGKAQGGVTGCIYDPADPETGTFSGAYANTGTGPDGGGLPGAENCSTGTQFPVPFEWGYGQQIWNRGANAGVAADDWAMVDTIRVPGQAGEFVLRWRW